jgi:hypothetical protein
MNAQEIVNLAFSRLGFGLDGSQVTAEQVRLGEQLLRALFAGLPAVPHFDLSDVPAPAQIPLAELLAAELAPSFPGIPAPLPRHLALLRLLAVIRPDDRPIPKAGPIL